MLGQKTSFDFQTLFPRLARQRSVLKNHPLLSQKHSQKQKQQLAFSFVVNSDVGFSIYF